MKYVAHRRLAKAQFVLAGALTIACFPLPVWAQEQAQAEREAVSYEDAMQCSALFSLVSAGAEGKEAAMLESVATRWLVIAMARDGTEDGSRATSALSDKVDALIVRLEASPDEASSEKFLIEGLEVCETRQSRVSNEFASIVP